METQEAADELVRLVDIIHAIPIAVDVKEILVNDKHMVVAQVKAIATEDTWFK